MSNRIFDASQLTKRKAEKAIAGSFLSRLYPPNSGLSPQQGFAPLLGIYDSSVMNAVKSGHMTQYTRFPTCYGISPGCPCPEINGEIVNRTYVPPGPVDRITYTAGSIIVSWRAPTVGDGPFTYRVTPFLFGDELPSIETTDTSYRFTDLQELKPYTFTITAMNDVGSGPVVPAPSYFIAPPNTLSAILSGIMISSVPIESSFKYILCSALNTLFEYAAKANLGPTKGSRFMYVFIASIVGAWNFVRPEVRVTGEHDNWNWNSKLPEELLLSDSDSIIWLCIVIDHIMPQLIGNYHSIFNCPADSIERVKEAAHFDTWAEAWQAWYSNRQNDGSVEAATNQPTTSANWSSTIDIDSNLTTNIWGFNEPRQWTPLTVQGKKQKYLTHSWDSVLSTCLTEEEELIIENEELPLTGDDRDAEIVRDIINKTPILTDEEKILAEFWAGGPGTVSPPLMFIWLWKEYIKSLSEISCTDIMYSLLDLGIHLFEGGRVTWRLKAAHMEARPIQEVRRMHAGKSITLWNGQTIDGSQWIPYQEANFVTPPFADFPSGHSHFSKAFALTMSKWFGPDITKGDLFYDGLPLICPLFKESTNGKYGEFVIDTGKSLIQTNVVPQQPVTLNYLTWDDMADGVGMSRIYGGIHCLTAHTTSQSVAEEVHNAIEEKWNILTTQ
jgi:hypothetical protein